MELEEIKNIWGSEAIKSDSIPQIMNNDLDVEFTNQTKSFQISEVFGCVLAYVLAGIILFFFNLLDHWYLKVCGVILFTYFLIMPFYTLSIIKKLRHPDLIRSNYKEVLEHFDSTQKNLNRAEQISFIASPFLFIASTILLVKIFLNIDVFSLNLELPVISVVFLAFFGATIFNIWAFRKRKRHLKSVTQLLEQDNY